MSAKEIFQDALDQPAAQRDAWVRAQCGDDVALREQVESLLTAHADATGLDRGPAAAMSAFGGAGSGAPSAPLEEIGTVIDGRYELLSILGEGGFGVVYRARQTSPVVREVALKILRVGLDSHQIVARFEAERQTLALMDHPGIARVYDAGETTGGRPYIAMEFVDGEPITRFCEHHSLGLDARLRLIEQVCMAIQHAHTKGIIHRDLKPTNILVTLLDGEPFPTVIDFGIAKAVDPDASARVNAGVQLTQEFQIIGTPQYMSPEQATRGGAGGIDTRSDVYSIGTVLYELIAGVPPFDPAELRKAGLEGVLRVIREDTPARPSTRLLSDEQTSASIATATRTLGEAPARLSRRVAGDVDWIVMRSLEKEPARRYQTAADFAADIRRHLAHEPVLAGPPSRLYQAKKFIRRHRVAVAAAAIVVLALVATAAISTEAARRARAAERVAVANAERATKAEAAALENERTARRELTKAVAVVSFTDQLLSGVGPAVARGRDTTLLREILDEAARTTPEKLKNEPLVDLVVRHIIAKVMQQLGEMQAAYDLLRPAWDATATVTDRKDKIERLSTGFTVGELLSELGQVGEGNKLLREVLAEFEALGLAHSEDVIDTVMALASNAVDRNDYAEAKTFAQRAIDLSRTVGRDDPQNLELSRGLLAKALFAADDFDGSIKVYEEDLADVIKRTGPDSPAALAIKSSLGRAYREVGRLPEAEKYLREVIDADRKEHEPGDPALLYSLNNLGDFYEGLNRFEEAVTVLEEAHHTSTLKLPPENSLVMVIDARLARAYLGVKRYEEAIALDRDVIDKTLRQEPLDKPQLLLVLRCLVQAQTGAGRPREALESVAKYTPKEGWSEGVDPFFEALFDIAVGRAHLDLGELDAARKAADQTRELFAKEGRTRGRYFNLLVQLDADIAVATTRPTTMPASNPTTAPAAQ